MTVWNENVPAAVGIPTEEHRLLDVGVQQLASAAAPLWTCLGRCPCHPLPHQLCIVIHSDVHSRIGPCTYNIVTIIEEGCVRPALG